MISIPVTLLGEDVEVHVVGLQAARYGWSGTG